MLLLDSSNGFGSEIVIRHITIPSEYLKGSMRETIIQGDTHHDRTPQHRPDNSRRKRQDSRRNQKRLERQDRKRNIQRHSKQSPHDQQSRKGKPIMKPEHDQTGTKQEATINHALRQLGLIQYD